LYEGRISSFDSLAIKNLAIEIFGKRAGVKETNIAPIRQLVEEGFTIDEISDKLRFEGQSEKFKGGYKSSFEFVTKKGFSTADRIASKDGLDELLEDGDTEGAKDYIQGLARDKATSTQRDQLFGRDDALNSLERIKKGLADLESQGIDTGFFTGLQEKVLEAGGFDVGTPGQNALSNEIAIAIIDYRRAVSGAAFTESEGAAYERVFPSTGKTTELNSSKIDSLITNMNARQDSFYRREIGTKNYDKLFLDNEQRVDNLSDDEAFAIYQQSLTQ
jgi:hypothetical protein